VLASALENLSPAYQGVAVIALDHPRVRAAIDELTGRGVAVVTLVSDAPSSRRLHYVGIDNPAAGRTAATLMGRFLAGREGAVAVIAGSLSLRDHTERQFGFYQILSSEYPDCARFRSSRGATTATERGSSRPRCWRAMPISAASIAAAPGTAASPMRSRPRDARARWSGSPMS